jgi:hypothetical protein
VRVLEKMVAPGMQHTEEADPSPEMLGIGGDLQQRGGSSSEQEIVDEPLVLESQPGEFMGKGEDHMEVADREEFSMALLEPLVARAGQTLRAMAITARVVRDDAMTALGTAIEMAAQGGGAAVLDGVEHAPVVPRQPGTVLLDKTVAVLSKDVGHLEGWPLHRFCNFRESLMLSGLETLSVSRGFATAVKCFRERCR